eukprot:4821144-Pyramimonas_sp.AAC.1
MPWSPHSASVGFGLRICLMRWRMWNARGGHGPNSRKGATTSTLLPNQTKSSMSWIRRTVHMLAR